MIPVYTYCTLLSQFHVLITNTFTALSPQMHVSRCFIMEPQKSEPLIMQILSVYMYDGNT